MPSDERKANDELVCDASANPVGVDALPMPDTPANGLGVGLTSGIHREGPRAAKPDV